MSTLAQGDLFINGESEITRFDIVCYYLVPDEWKSGLALRARDKREMAESNEPSHRQSAPIKLNPISVNYSNP